MQVFPLSRSELATVYHTVHSQKVLEVGPFNDSIRILNIHIFVASTLNIIPSCSIEISMPEGLQVLSDY